MLAKNNAAWEARIVPAPSETTMHIPDPAGRCGVGVVSAKMFRWNVVCIAPEAVPISQGLP